MKNLYYKKLMLIAVKYGPALLAFTGSLKIFLINKLECDECFFIHLINVFLDFFLLGSFWIQGKTLGFCWKHQSLCRATMWGYIYYLFFLLSGTTSVVIEYLTYFYLGFIIFIFILYEKIN